MIIDVSHLDDGKESGVMSSTETLVEDEEKPRPPIDICNDEEIEGSTEAIEIAEVQVEGQETKSVLESANKGDDQDKSTIPIAIGIDQEINESREAIETIEVQVEEQEIKSVLESENKGFEVIEDVEEITKHQILRRDPQIVVIKTMDDYKRLSHISEEIDFNEKAELESEEDDSDVEDLIDKALKEEVDLSAKTNEEKQIEPNLDEHMIDISATNDGFALQENLVKADVVDDGTIDHGTMDHNDAPASKKKKGFKGLGKKFKNIMRRNSAPKVEPIKKSDISSPLPIDSAEIESDNCNNLLPMQPVEAEEKHHGMLDLPTKAGKLLSFKAVLF